MATSVPQVVMDTSVFTSALRSRRGASHLLLSLLDSGRFELNLSIPLLFEYEAVGTRLVGQIPLTEGELEDILNYVCKVAHHRRVYFLWRPFLPDPGDDMVLELAVAAQCDYVLTYNLTDFRGAERFGIRVMTPKEFLQEIGVLS
jgi:predicted nucleic acid-binding protein